ncbi:hypothetical protein M2436_002457 [Streptomyces sp. HB372]|nr:hypothetical protein [Streptomyces sp. HB372]
MRGFLALDPLAAQQEQGGKRIEDGERDQER